MVLRGPVLEINFIMDHTKPNSYKEILDDLFTKTIMNDKRFLSKQTYMLVVV